MSIPSVPAFPSTARGTRAFASAAACALLLAACDDGDDAVTGPPLQASADFPVVQVPPGYRLERVVAGLTYPTAVAWDAQGRLYVTEAGGGFVEDPAPARILRVQNGVATEFVNLEARGVADAVAGMSFLNGALYVTHREPADRSGAVSRVSLDGAVTRVLTGFRDSQSEHQVNDVRPGPDGRLYLAVGPTGNSGVVGLDLAPFESRSPGVRTTSCVDLVLTGRNFETPDFRTPDPSDAVQTGAYVPFGTRTTPGQRVAATRKCGGAIFSFDPANAEATLRAEATGLRNVIGLAWNSRGEMFAGVNGYDVRGSRPVFDFNDATYRVVRGTWYGWPDFSAALEPLTDARFDNVPDALQAPVFVGGQPQPKRLGFLIDHAASGLRAPDRSLVTGLHELNASPSMLAAAPASWGELQDHLFVAEWGDLAPGTTPLRDGPAGFQVVRLAPGSTRAIPFVRNAQDGPASRQGALGRGIERPYDVKFGPDGALYIVDYGVGNVNPTVPNKPPYEFVPRTGAVWRVSRAP